MNEHGAQQVVSSYTHCQMHPNALSFIIVLSALKVLDRVSPGLGFAWRWRCAVTVAMKLLTILKQNHQLTQGVLDSISNPASFCRKFWSSNWRHARSPSRTNFNSSCGSQWKICELIRPPTHKRQMDRRCLLDLRNCSQSTWILPFFHHPIRRVPSFGGVGSHVQDCQGHDVAVFGILLFAALHLTWLGKGTLICVDEVSTRKKNPKQKGFLSSVKNHCLFYLFIHDHSTFCLPRHWKAQEPIQCFQAQRSLDRENPRHGIME